MNIVKNKIYSPEENTVVLKYVEWSKEFEEIEEFVENIGKKIAGIGPDDRKFQLKINNIMYFEADGDLVFAYTDKDIYKINMRLYQVEEIVKESRILRASKSHLININKIDSVRSALNSRLYAKMENGEEILVSRQYVKSIADAIKTW